MHKYWLKTYGLATQCVKSYTKNEKHLYESQVQKSIYGMTVYIVGYLFV